MSSRLVTKNSMSGLLVTKERVEPTDLKLPQHNSLFLAVVFSLAIKKTSDVHRPLLVSPLLVSTMDDVHSLLSDMPTSSYTMFVTTSTSNTELETLIHYSTNIEFVLVCFIKKS